MSDTSKQNLMGLDASEMAELVKSLGEPGYRTQQLLEAVYRQRLSTVEAISTLPQQLRARLEQDGLSIGLPSIDQRFVSSDGTVRYLIGFGDGQTVETVWMPEGDGGELGDGTEAGEADQAQGRGWQRATICVSSQVGCAVDCQFCMTALLGVKRNLTA